MADKKGKGKINQKYNQQDAIFGGKVNGSTEKINGGKQTFNVSVSNASFGVGIKTEGRKNTTQDPPGGTNAKNKTMNGENFDHKKIKAVKAEKTTDAVRNGQLSDRPHDQRLIKSLKAPTKHKKPSRDKGHSVCETEPRAEILEPINGAVGGSSTKDQTIKTQTFLLDTHQSNQENKASPGGKETTLNSTSPNLQSNVSASNENYNVTSNSERTLNLKLSTNTKQEKTKRQDSVSSDDLFRSDIRADGRRSAYDCNGDPMASGKANLQMSGARQADIIDKPGRQNSHDTHFPIHKRDYNFSCLEHETSNSLINTPKGNSLPSHSMKVGIALSLIKVKASRKSIAEWQVDVIVSSDSSKLQGGGMVSKAITERGGRQLQTFKDSVIFMCQTINDWTFQPTPASGALQCKHVFHVVVPHFTQQSQSQWIDGMDSLIKDILHRTEQFGYKSIAIPVIGSGRNSAPTEFIIELICGAIKEYAACRSGICCLETILLVHPDRQVEKYIEKKIIEFNFTTSNKRPKSPKKKDTEIHLLDVRDRKYEKCPICMEETKESKLKQLSKCSHIFCKKCIDECFKRAPVCPICNMVYGTMTGNQPNGTMVEVFIKDAHLPGYTECGIIKIFYHFPDGTQGKEHPNTGLPYKGTKRSAYLPDNEDGQKVHRLLRRAFNQRLVFTIGNSRTTGREDVVTWNDIHHKTHVNGGPEKYGYPDPSYLSRVLEELAAKGITED